MHITSMDDKSTGHTANLPSGHTSMASSLAKQWNCQTRHPTLEGQKGMIEEKWGVVLRTNTEVIPCNTMIRFGPYTNLILVMIRWGVTVQT